MFDLGQNMVGWARLQVQRPSAARRCTLRFAEMLNPDGTIYTDQPARRARAPTRTSLTGGGAESVRAALHLPRLPLRRGDRLSRHADLDAVTGVVVALRHAARPARFDCSNALVNQLQHNIVWGQRGNFLERADRLPAARRAARLDGRRAGLRPHRHASTWTSPPSSPSGSTTCATRSRPDGAFPDVAPGWSSTATARRPGATRA